MHARERSYWQHVCWWLALACMPCLAEIAPAPQLRIIGPWAGLPSTDIVGLGQDMDGDVWIATKDGLARYDGINMAVWQHDPRDPASLPENRLQTLHVGGDGRVWVGSITQGAAALDPALGTFVRYGRERFAQMRSNSVLAIATWSGAVWLGTMDGLYQITDDGRFQAWWHDPDDPASLPGRTVINLRMADDGALWAATTGGLARIDPNGQLQRMRLPDSGNLPLAYSVVPEGGRIWVGTANGVLVGDGSGQWEAPSWSGAFARPNAALDLIPDPAGGLWLGTQRGAWRVSPDGTVIPVAPTADPAPMPVFSVLLQPDGALWIPVYGQGIGYLRSDWRQVAQFAHGTPALAGDRYHAITPAREGGVWLLARNAAMERIARRGVVERLDARISAALRADRPVALAVDEDGAFWLGGHDCLIRVHRDGKIDRWRHGDARDAALPGPNLGIIAAPGGRIWINNGTTGLQLRDARSGAVVRNFLHTGHASSDTQSRFHLGDLDQMEVGPDAALWVGGVDGLARLDPDTGLSEEPALRGARVLAFGFDGAHVLWLFRSHQLERFELHAGRWTRADTVGTDAGLPVVDVGGLCVDAQHRVWLSTPRGLYRWDPATRHVQHVGVQHGLHSQEFNERALVLDAEGMLTGITIDGGVAMIDTKIADPPVSTPRLNLRQIAVRRDGQWQVKWQRPVSGMRLTFTHEEREFRIGMRLPHYDAPRANRYFSYLEGHDQDWVAQGHQGDRVFSGIAPGDYRLHLRATDASGHASSVHTLGLNLRPPWWESHGFRALVLIALGALALLSAALYRRRLQRRHAWQLAEHKRTLAEHSSLAKTRFLATFGHEVRTPMTGVLGMSELLLATPLGRKQRDCVEAIHHAGQHLLRLVNDALDLARIESGRLELERVAFALIELIDEVIALMAPLARARALDFEHEIDPELPPWVIGDGGRVRQILLNLTGNAVKFTEHGCVGLRVRTLPGGNVAFAISDTGPGFNPEHVERLFRRFEQAEGMRTTARYGGSGLGLAISQELAAAMGGRIDVTSAPGKGATFTVELPLSATTSPPTQTPSSTQTIRQSLHLLLVEDDPTVAAVMTGFLNARGHRVIHASHGLAALAQVRSLPQPFDAALLDLDLPGLDGMRLAGLLREQGMNAPLIAVTARADADAEPDAQKAGFSAFIRKPLTGDMLAGVIAQALGGAESGP